MALRMRPLTIVRRRFRRQRSMAEEAKAGKNVSECCGEDATTWRVTGGYVLETGMTEMAHVEHKIE